MHSFVQSTQNLPAFGTHKRFRTLRKRRNNYFQLFVANLIPSKYFYV